MKKIHRFVEYLPGLIEVLSLRAKDGYIPVHSELYADISKAADTWFFEWNHQVKERVVPPADPLLSMLKTKMDICGSLIPVLVLWSVLRSRFQGKGRTQFEHLFLSLKMRVSVALDGRELSVAEEGIFQALFQNPLFLGVEKVRENAYGQMAARLFLPLQEGHIDGLSAFIQSKRNALERKKKLRVEEVMLLGLLAEKSVEECLEKRGEQILICLGQIAYSDAPVGLRSISAAYAVAACWVELQQRIKEGLAVEYLFSLLQKTDAWSYGNPNEQYCVLIQGEHEWPHPGYRWGRRHILIFSEVEAAVDFVWQNQALPLLLIKSNARYPNAEALSEIDLKSDIQIDLESMREHIKPHKSCDGVLFGQNQTYYVCKNRLQQEEPISEDVQKENAKRELERLFIDFENDDE
ncbi:MAG: hypothetical protein VX278_01555 [Myxococcota bacterium]|nr:hypothetical protein [Myxococcota bacterium]